MTDPSREHDSDYLWDRSGPPDPLVAALERRLAPLGLAGRRRAPPAPRPRLGAYWLVAALALLTALPFALLPSHAEARYDVLLRAGEARIRRGWSETRLAAGRAALAPVGSLLVCDPGARVRLRVGEDPSGLDLGEVEIEGPAALRLDAASAELRRLYLHNGTLHARISAFARERLFQVGTPSGNAVDLGCVYTMQVGGDAAALMRVQLGRVAFELPRQTLYVWAGARCNVRRDAAYSLPIDEGAAADFAAAAQRWERAGSAEERLATLAAMARSARTDDAATLWHMLASSAAAERGPAAKLLDRIAPAPDGVWASKASLGDSAALEAWRVSIMGW